MSPVSSGAKISSSSAAERLVDRVGGVEQPVEGARLLVLAIVLDPVHERLIVAVAATAAVSAAANSSTPVLGVCRQRRCGS